LILNKSFQFVQLENFFSWKEVISLEKKEKNLHISKTLEQIKKITNEISLLDSLLK
jgi:hypothetical protein